MGSFRLSRRALIGALGLAGLGACSRDPGKPAAEPALALPAPAPGSLEWAAAGAWRIAADRDTWRHPVETLKFFGIRSNMTVLEVLPGQGWYSAVLAPYLARGGGKLYAATFNPEGASPAQLETVKAYRDRFLADKATFGGVEMTVLDPKGGRLAPDDSCDLALIMRNMHTLMAMGAAEQVLRDVMRALKPGGVLGIEQHRGKATGLQDPQAASGYVQEAFVKQIASEAGFEFVGASQINANPKDDREHPFGVWSLPPVLRTAPLGSPPDPSFDTAPYDAIGESDRMTLKFRKPLTPPAPLKSGGGR